jgi:hypothetical protein
VAGDSGSVLTASGSTKDAELERCAVVARHAGVACASRRCRVSQSLKQPIPAVTGVEEQWLRPLRATKQEVRHREERDRAAQPLLHANVDVSEAHLTASLCQNGHDGSSNRAELPAITR